MHQRNQQGAHSFALTSYEKDVFNETSKVCCRISMRWNKSIWSIWRKWNVYRKRRNIFVHMRLALCDKWFILIFMMACKAHVRLREMNKRKHLSAFIKCATHTEVAKSVPLHSIVGAGLGFKYCWRIDFGVNVSNFSSFHNILTFWRGCDSNIDKVRYCMCILYEAFNLGGWISSYCNG